MKTVSGTELKVGDTIKTWWGNDTITALRPYVGPLADLWNGKATIASFARNTTGMTIEGDHGEYEVVSRMSPIQE